MARPNFFIVGAAKCGTTSLARYLAAHPNVFVSMPKEPAYFNDDFGWRNVRDLEAYEALFDPVTGEQAIGEASVMYLPSQNAVPNILRYDPSARLIVMVRNPVEMVESWHAHLLFVQQEDVESLEDAWALQGSRARGQQLPSGTRDPRVLQYGRFCRLGEQVERLLSVAPRDQVHVILLDDMRADALTTYRGVLRFLGVQEEASVDFSIHNPRQEARSRTLARLLRTLKELRQRMGLRRTGLLASVNRLNRRPARLPEVSPAFREVLISHFSSDIEKLARIIRRDLTHWLA